MILAAAVVFLTFHRPDGAVVAVNPRHVSSVIPPRDHGHFAPGVKCTLHFHNGKWLSVKETCAEVNAVFAKAS